MKLLQCHTGNHVLYCALLSAAYFQLCYRLSSASPVCDTPECKNLGEYYIKNMKEHGQPCTDFYDSVCHNWGTHNPRPKHKTIWNVVKWLEQRSTEAMKHALENVLADNATVVRQAKELYSACINLPFAKRSDSKTKSIMRAAGHWPMVNTKDSKESQNVPWWEIESYYVSKAGESSILDFYLVANTRNNNQITILMIPPHSPYGMLKLFAPFHASHKKRYKAFLLDVIKKAAAFDIKSSSYISRDLDDVINFREEIKGIKTVRNIANDSILTTLADFQQFYNRYSAGHETAKIKWSKMISALYANSKNPHGLAIEKAPMVIMPLTYFSSLANILAKTPKHVIVNHVHLYFAERHVELSTQMKTNLENSFIAGARPTGKIRYEPERWETCVSNHNMITTLGYMYVQRHFPNTMKNEVEGLLKELVQFLEIRISKSSWLDDITKCKTMYKLDRVQSQIGHPYGHFHISDLYRPPIASDVNPITPFAAYTPTMNRVSKYRLKNILKFTLCASASYLQWPIYMPNMPYAMKYGATGFVIGHELVHAIDEIGLRFDPSGVQKNWWLDYMYGRYNIQTDCFEQQYKRYKNSELRERNITKSPEKSTNVEDIADVMGLKIAYMGYREQLRKNNGSCPILPGFEELGCDKLFFIAFANVLCAASTPSAEEEILLNHSHNSPRIRVNGAVGNMKEFHEAFHCETDAPIIPTKMCDIWK